MTEQQNTQQDAAPESRIRYEIGADGTIRALLPCGKKPEIVPVYPPIIRDIYAAHPRPEPPEKHIEIEGSGLAERFTADKDPDYMMDVWEWQLSLLAALTTRFVLDALVVPEDPDFLIGRKPYVAMPDCPEHGDLAEVPRIQRLGKTAEEFQELEENRPEKGDCTCIQIDSDWSWKLRATGVQVPSIDGPDRQFYYAKEALLEIFTNHEDQLAFTTAVRQISTPTEAGIEAARHRFRDALEKEAAGRSKSAKR